MQLDVGKEVAALKRMTMKELRHRYAEVFGDQTNANNKAWLIKRIAWRLQFLAEGGLSERARQHAAELAKDADVRLAPPRPRNMESVGSTMAIPFRPEGSNRLPPPGTVITRPYKGSTLQVQVLPQGFEYEGATYKSLSAVAKAITGTHCNGYLFFHLRKEEGR